MLNDTSSLRAHLATRRSAKPRFLVAPGPDAPTLDAIITLAARTPDHGKLAPWRFVHIASDDRAAFAALLRRAYAADKPAATRLELEAVDSFAHQAPCLIAVVSKPVRPHKIPIWEQELSAGAAVMNLLHAAHAHGFVATWITGWAAFNPVVAAALGVGPEDRLAGFVFIGTPGTALEERPRPELASVFDTWQPPAP